MTPPLPSRLARLPAYGALVVPWFVQWLDAAGHPTDPGASGARPDHRIMDAAKLARAIADRRCWTCGQRLGRHLAFVIGPMCAVNRISAEPPSHRECAVYSARTCPFLSTPARVRREHGLPGDAAEPAGEMLRRNPGVTLVWVTTSYAVFNDGQGSL